MRPTPSRSLRETSQARSHSARSSSSADVSLISSGHDVADARLHREVRALLAAGLRVEVLGLGDAAAGPPGAVVSARPRPSSVVRRGLRALTLPWQARGAVIVTLDPDLVAPASVRARLGRRRLVVDVHEDYAALAHDRAWARGVVGAGARAVVQVALRLAARADLLAVADAHVPPQRARRRLVLPNLPDPGLLPPPAEPDDTPRAVYIGDVRHSRGLRTMLAAVEDAPAWTLDVVGPVAPADAAWVASWQASSAAAARVRWHGRLAPAEAWRLAPGAWVGLCLLDDTPAFRAAMPSKAYEYLACGLPLLATPLPRLAALVDESGAGALAADSHEASARLRDWSADPASLHSLRHEARQWSATHLAGRTPYDEFASAVRDLARLSAEEKP